MIRYFLLFTWLTFLTLELTAQTKTENGKDLRSDWMTYKNNQYTPLDKTVKSINTIYFKLETDQYPDAVLSIHSMKPFFLLLNGKIAGEYQGEKKFNLDSLAEAHYTPSFFIAIHQRNINLRDLQTIIKFPKPELSSSLSLTKPPTYFKDFVILAGLVVIVLFLATTKLNPKLASDYFSVTRIFSLREGEDAQSNARLTGTSNILFYIICSLLLGFYLIIVVYHLPDQYVLPLYFEANTFWAVAWQWLRLSSIILIIFFTKILLIFSLTRLFGLHGLARIHFFNWVRFLLIVFGTASIIIFTYFISRGTSEYFFVVFLSLVVGTLIAWTLLVFLKLNNKTEHSMFHLFSYICATEIIPLLITIKVLFQ